jgi:hypothetical protein
MSTSEKPDLARGWQRAVKLVGELDERAERLAAMSDEEFEREMEKQPAPAHVPTVEALVARGAARATMRKAAKENSIGKVAGLPLAPSARKPRAVWLVAAALGVMVFVLAVERREIVAWMTHDNVRPDNQWVEPSPDRRAVALREKAFDACHDGLWTECEDTLIEAKKLDPAGDMNPRVQAAHKAALEGMSRDLRKPGPDRKPLPDTK